MTAFVNSDGVKAIGNWTKTKFAPKDISNNNVTGTLAVSHGGTGLTDLSKVSVGLANIAVSATSAGRADTATRLIQDETGRVASLNIDTDSQYGLKYNLATSSTTTGKPGEDGHVLTMMWDNSGGWNSLLSQNCTNGGLQVRALNGGTWSKWVKVYDENHKPSKADIGLGNVNNTADSSKSVNYASTAGSATKWNNQLSLNWANSTTTTGLMLTTDPNDKSGNTITKINPINVRVGSAATADAHTTYIMDLSKQDNTKFYPMTVPCARSIWECEIYNTEGHAAADVYTGNEIKFDLLSQGWTDVKLSCNVYSYAPYNDNKITIGCIARGNYAGVNCVWLRGGYKYSVISNRIPTIHTTDYSAGSGNNIEKFTVGTNYYGGTNSGISVVFTPNQYGSTCTYFLNPIEGVLRGIKPIADDTTNNNPQWYMTNYPGKIVAEIKTTKSIGVDSRNTKCYLLTFCLGNIALNTTNGYICQWMCYPLVGTLWYRRASSATSWGTWYKIVTSSDIANITDTYNPEVINSSDVNDTWEDYFGPISNQTFWYLDTSGNYDFGIFGYGANGSPGVYLINPSTGKTAHIDGSMSIGGSITNWK